MSSESLGEKDFPELQLRAVASLYQVMNINTAAAVLHSMLLLCCIQCCCCVAFNAAAVLCSMRALQARLMQYVACGI